MEWGLPTDESSIPLVEELYVYTSNSTNSRNMRKVRIDRKLKGTTAGGRMQNSHSGISKTYRAYEYRTTVYEPEPALEPTFWITESADDGTNETWIFGTNDTTPKYAGAAMEGAGYAWDAAEIGYANEELALGGYKRLFTYGANGESAVLNVSAATGSASWPRSLLIPTNTVLVRDRIDAGNLLKPMTTEEDVWKRLALEQVAAGVSEGTQLSVATALGATNPIGQMYFSDYLSLAVDAESNALLNLEENKDYLEKDKYFLGRRHRRLESRVLISLRLRAS